MTLTRVALARAWGVAPAALRDVDLTELGAMVDLLSNNHADG